MPSDLGCGEFGARIGNPYMKKVLKHAKRRWLVGVTTLLLFFSTLVDNRRTIMLVIEPLSQSDRANSNSCFSD
jgi:hypothetical protein